MEKDTAITIAPALGPQIQQEFEHYVRWFTDMLAASPDTERGICLAVTEFRDELRQRSSCPSNTTLKLLLSLHVIADLVAQGWSLRTTDGAVTLTHDAEDDGARSKEAVRKSHLVERDSQLREPAVAEFIRGMEKRRLTAKGWHSIYSLMRDGKDLACRLQRSAEIPDVDQRLEQLGHTITPL